MQIRIDHDVVPDRSDAVDLTGDFERLIEDASAARNATDANDPVDTVDADVSGRLGSPFLSTTA